MLPLLCPSVQNQVDEVIDVMQENITKVIERGERLDDLQDKSGVMSNTALLAWSPGCWAGLTWFSSENTLCQTWAYISVLPEQCCSDLGCRSGFLLTLSPLLPAALCSH